MSPSGWQTIARTAGAGLTAQPSARTSIRMRMFVAGPELPLKGSPTIAPARPPPCGGRMLYRPGRCGEVQDPGDATGRPGPSRLLLRRAGGDEVQHALRRLGAGH